MSTCLGRQVAHGLHRRPSTPVASGQSPADRSGSIDLVESEMRGASAVPALVRDAGRVWPSTSLKPETGFPTPAPPWAPAQVVGEYGMSAPRRRMLLGTGPFYRTGAGKRSRGVMGPTGRIRPNDALVDGLGADLERPHSAPHDVQISVESGKRARYAYVELSTFVRARRSWRRIDLPEGPLDEAFVGAGRA